MKTLSVVATTLLLLTIAAPIGDARCSGRRCCGFARSFECEGERGSRLFKGSLA